MSTNPPEKRKLRFTNPQPLNLDTRVGQTIVDGGFRVGDWDNLFVGLGERLTSEAKRAATKGPIVYRLRPARVLMSSEHHQRIMKQRRNISDALATPRSVGIEFEPQRVDSGTRSEDFS